MDTSVTEKPMLLQAIELILAKPEAIKQESLNLLDKLKNTHSRKTDAEIRHLASEKVISNYSYYAAFVGGTTALTGVIPGIGTALAVGGGASADAVASMKFQIEMTMALATIYDHDILVEEEKRICYIIAGLGAISEGAKEGGKAVTSKAFIKLVQENLKGPLLEAIKAIFKNIGITFTRKALEKAIPFGIGVVIGFTANKGLTWYVGSKARDFFSADA